MECKSRSGQRRAEVQGFAFMPQVFPVVPHSHNNNYDFVNIISLVRAHSLTSYPLVLPSLLHVTSQPVV